MNDKNMKGMNLERYTTAIALQDGAMINLRAIGMADGDKVLSFF